LYQGIFNSVPWQKNLVRYRSFFGRTKILPFTPDVAEYFGRVKADLQKRGALVADNDLWIAAHALEHDATPVTNNERDFSRIRRLKLVNWAA
jgi:tRNA(fMet)-specific endonuclease VapC